MWSIFNFVAQGVMVRLMLILAPVACVLSAVSISATLSSFSAIAKSSAGTADEAAPTATVATPTKKGAAAGAASAAAPRKRGRDSEIHRDIGFAVVAGLAVMLLLYTFHCTWVTSEAYSSPSIVLAARQPDGSRLIFDDFREVHLLPLMYLCFFDLSLFVFSSILFSLFHAQ